jgi:hypothetical protein
MRTHSTDRRAEKARFRRSLRGARWQYVETARGLAWALLLRSGKRTPWLGEWVLPHGPELWRPDGLFYRYFAREVSLLIGVDARRFEEFARVVSAAKIPLPGAPFLRVVKAAS